MEKLVKSPWANLADFWHLEPRFWRFKKSEQKQKKTIYLHTVAPLDFRTFLRADSKKEAKFTTDKSSKDQLSEGKAVRDLLFGHTVYFWILEFSELHDDLTEKSDAFSVYLLIR